MKVILAIAITSFTFGWVCSDSESWHSYHECRKELQTTQEKHAVDVIKLQHVPLRHVKEN